MLRHNTVRTVNVEAKPVPPAPEVEQIDVTRLDIVFDNGLNLTFDIEDGESFRDTPDRSMLVIQKGQRIIEIAKARIIYSEVRPAKANRVISPNAK